MNLIQITQKLPTEFDAVKFLEKHRWKGKVRCAYCKSQQISNRADDWRYHCMNCNKSFSVTTNTQLHNTKTDLQKWLMAFSVISDAKKGMSALQLQRNIGVSYPTAFAMYHKIRELMAIENSEVRLDGYVEMDETYIGGKPRKGNKLMIKQRKDPDLDEQIKELREKGWRFRRNKGNPAKITLQPKAGTMDKIPVTGIVERDGDVIAQVMEKVSHLELKKMVQKYVDEDNAVLITDEGSGYKSMGKIIDHIAIDHSRMYSYRGVNSNSIESFWAIVKRGIMGQYHHVTLRKLPNYVSEFVFKYNNRKHDDMFITLVKKAVLPYVL